MDELKHDEIITRAFDKLYDALDADTKDWVDDQLEATHSMTEADEIVYAFEKIFDHVSAVYFDD